MNIFNFEDYKILVQKLVENRPRRGHGQYRKLAETLRLSSVAISQIVKGPRDFSLEQALEVAQFFHLDAEETEYFLLLVQRSRAGTQKLRANFDKKIAHTQAERELLAKRVKHEADFSEQAKAIFYSNWQYSAVRIATSIPKLQSVEAIAAKLSMKPEEVAPILQFLLENGLCKKEGNGYALGPSSTMLPKDSPFINSHRREWRLKSIEHLRRLGPQDMFYTGLVSLSAADLRAFRQELVELVARFTERVKESPSETMACLNLDWYEFQR